MRPCWEKTSCYTHQEGTRLAQRLGGCRAWSQGWSPQGKGQDPGGRPGEEKSRAKASGGGRGSGEHQSMGDPHPERCCSLHYQLSIISGWRTSTAKGKQGCADSYPGTGASYLIPPPESHLGLLLAVGTPGAQPRCMAYGLCICPGPVLRSRPLC